MVVTRSQRIFSKVVHERTRRMPWRSYATIKDGVKQYFHDFVAIEVEENDTTTIQLHSMKSCGLGGDEVCPITQEKFSDIADEQVSQGPVFCEKKPKLCIARLPCGHYFSVMAIARSFVLHSMKCPVCRHGISFKAGLRSVPAHLRRELQQARERAREEQLREEQMQLQEAQENFWREEMPDIHIAMGWDGPGFAVTAPAFTDSSTSEVLVQFRIYNPIVLMATESFMLQRSDARPTLLLLNLQDHIQIMRRINEPNADAMYIILYQWGDDGREVLLATSIYLPCDMVRTGADQLIDMDLLTASNSPFPDRYRLHWQPIRY